ncbi:hypothetical protein V6N12_033689, partial [Hibiscus sabdariffa]
VQLNQRDINCY